MLLMSGAGRSANPSCVVFDLAVSLERSVVPASRWKYRAIFYTGM